MILFDLDAGTVLFDRKFENTPSGQPVKMLKSAEVDNDGNVTAEASRANQWFLIRKRQ